MQRLEVIDLAIEDDPYSPILVREWLVAARKVDDAQPVEAQSDIVFEIEADIIGSPMAGHVTHSVDKMFLNPALAIEIK
jgi:hypothetical protein